MKSHAIVDGHAVLPLFECEYVCVEGGGAVCACICEYTFPCERKVLDQCELEIWRQISDGES